MKETLQERLWLWCHNPGVYNNIEPLGGSSTCTAVEGANFFDIDNILMVVYDGKPRPPFDPVQQEFRHLHKVIWSLVGDCASKYEAQSTADLDAVLSLRAKYPNVVSGIMDDFFADKRQFDLNLISETMRKENFPLTVVLYEHDLVREKLAEKLALCDVINFWTWEPLNLLDLDANLECVRSLAPGKPIMLGCYLWDFHQTGEPGKTLTVEQMQFQCQKALKYWQQGMIDDIVILGSPLIGMPLPTIEWTRQWLNEVRHSTRNKK